MPRKNPIDPATGKPKRGRPKVVKPLEQLPAEEPKTPESSSVPEVKALDGSDVKALQEKAEKLTNEEARDWYSKISGTGYMEVPADLKKKYPNCDFCWGPGDNDPMRMSQYLGQFGYKVAQLDRPEQGALDTIVRRRDSILLVRPKELTKIHRKVEADMANPNRPKGLSREEREAFQRSHGVISPEAEQMTRDNPADKHFLNEPRDRSDYDESDYERDMQEVNSPRPKGAVGRGSKYWGGGIPS